MKNRSGSYKKVLLAADHLGPHRETLIKNIDLITSLPLAPFELCTLYILLFLRIRHPKNWLQKKNEFTPIEFEKKILDLIPKEFNLNTWEIEKLKNIGVKDLFQHYNLKGIPQAVNRTMLNWAQGHWKIELLTYIPGPRKLLQMQVKETRCITLTVKHDEIDTLVLSTRDPLSFVLHDLHHADMFFNQEESLKGQLGFYNLVSKIYDEPEIRKSLKADNQFRTEFDYVVSDMNAYVIHLFKCFKSAFIRSDEELFTKVLSWWKMPPHVLAASNRLNTPEFHAEDEFNLKLFFENSREALV